MRFEDLTTKGQAIAWCLTSLVCGGLFASCSRPEILATSTGTLVMLPGDLATRDVPVYSDRRYRFQSLGKLGGIYHVALANDDKALAARSYLQLRALTSSTVYLAFDRRVQGAPKWLQEEGFNLVPASETRIVTTDSGASPYRLYRRHLEEGAVLTLGGNYDPGQEPKEAGAATVSMYLLLYQGSLGRPAEAENQHFSARPVDFSTLHSDLCLGGAKPQHVDLPVKPPARARAHCGDLHGQDLSNSDLSRADLVASNLGHAGLDAAVLDDAEMGHASLVLANLRRASLRRANLSAADLSRANLRGADLAGADLSDAHLAGADFTAANLENVTFEPSDLPDVRRIATARGLKNLCFKCYPDALVALRDSFKKQGFHQQEREVAAALEREYATNAQWPERWVRKVALGLTCGYGLDLTRPWFLILASIAVFWLAYYAFARAGLGAIEASSRSDTDGDARPSPSLGVLCLQLSLSSAFPVSGEPNLGRWLMKLLPEPWTLRPVRFIRTLSGLQSLVSLYLIALWVVLFFGRPFE
jgi:hypothetical protein